MFQQEKTRRGMTCPHGGDMAWRFDSEWMKRKTGAKHRMYSCV